MNLPFYPPGNHPRPIGWITTGEYAKQSPLVSLHPLDPPTTLEVARFPLMRIPTSEQSPVTYTKTGQTYHFPPTFVAQIPNGSVLGGEGLIISDDNRLIADLAIHDGLPPEQHRVFQQALLPTIRKIDGRVAVIAANYGYNYFHGILNSVPRLHLLERLGLTYDWIYVPEITCSYQWPLLKRLELDWNKIIVGSRSLHIQADELIVPSLVAPSTDCSPQVCDSLRQLFSKEISVEPYRRLFIRRRGTCTRQVANENAVLSFLRKRGFECLDLEFLSLEQQVEHFAQAKVIIAQHGAALANLVFCNANAHVIEIFHPELARDSYWQISQYLNLHHHIFVETNTRCNRYQPKQGWARDFILDLKQLHHILVEIGC